MVQQERCNGLVRVLDSCALHYTKPSFHKLHINVATMKSTFFLTLLEILECMSVFVCVVCSGFGMFVGWMTFACIECV